MTAGALELRLKAFHLPSFLGYYEELARRAQDEAWPYVRYLDELAALEAQDRADRRITRLLKTSKLPRDKTLSTLELKRLPTAVRGQIQRLCEGEFLQGASNVCIFGNPGVGKTHTMAAIGYELVRQGHSVQTRELRLRPEWLDIDRHQKSVLSDELGMGLTTQLLAEELGFTLFADTLHFVRVASPRRFALVSTNKTGQGKSPDFIAQDSAGHYHVVECKGTQSSHRALTQAMSRGKAQKANLQQSSARIRHSLVIGLFIPQSNSAEAPRIHIEDPDWREINDALSKLTPRAVSRSLIQIELAKHLALAQSFGAAQYLATTPTEDLRAMPDVVRNSLQALDQYSQPRALFPFPDSPGAPVSSDRLRGTLTLQVPPRLSEDLVGDDLREVLDTFASDASTRGWESEGDDSFVHVASPLGFKFRLES